MGWDTTQDLSVHWLQWAGKAGTAQRVYDENQVKGTVFNLCSGSLK